MKKNKLINMTTKWFDVIQLDGWLYVVDKETARVGKPAYLKSNKGNCRERVTPMLNSTSHYMCDPYGIIASNNPALEGVAKLPEIGDNSTKVAAEYWKKAGLQGIINRPDEYLSGFVEGYKAASKLYTEEDVIALLKFIRDQEDFYELVDENLFETYIPSYTKQHLKPVISQVELETNEGKCMEERCLIHTCDGKCKLPKVIDNYVQIVNTK